MPIGSHKFDLLRASNPSAAFNALVSDLLIAIKEDRRMAEAFAKFQGHFKGAINTAADARRLKLLKERGAEKLDIRVGKLPIEMGPGLAFLYDTTLEALRSTKNRFDPRMINARSIGVVSRLLDLAMLRVGALTVTALEVALSDKTYADHLRERANELEWLARQPPPVLGSCEFCTVIVEDEVGMSHVTCPSEDDCKVLGGFFILVLIAMIAMGIVGWLLDDDD